MVKELDVSMVSEYTTRISKAMAANASPSGITCGWEWEIPVYLQDYERLIPLDSDDDVAHPFSKAWARARGFSAHFDSGGREIGSPVFNNLGTARRFAKFIQEAAEENANLRPHYYGSNCGIHVHVADQRHESSITQPMQDTWYRERERAERLGHSINIMDWFATQSADYREYERNRTFMDRVLNRASSQDFLWYISGRDRRGGGYNINAKSQKWDTSCVGTAPWHHPAMLKPNNSPAGMLAGGEAAATDTIEFRIWKGTSERLLPAIEFAHSFFKWARTQTPRLASDLDGVLFPQRGRFRMSPTTTYRLMTREEVGNMREIIPTIGSFTDWLDGQRGYANLKAQIGGYPNA